MIAWNNFYHHTMEIWSYAINFFTGYLFKMCKCMCTLNFLFNLLLSICFVIIIIIIRYIKYTLDQYVENDYTLVYFHHGLSSSNKPSFSWLYQVYKELDRKWV